MLGLIIVVLLISKSCLGFNYKHLELILRFVHISSIESSFIPRIHKIEFPTLLSSVLDASQRVNL